MTFNDLNLIPPLLEAISKEGYTEPTPIQEKAIPFILEGKDIFGCAQTGTGKTAAFALPLLQMLHKNKTSANQTGGTNGFVGTKVLILAPTRELALQINESFYCLWP